MTSPVTSSKIVPFHCFDIFRHCLKGGRVVVTNGCFDMLHIGHILYLQKAKAFGDVLVVGINDDLGVSILKGENRPVNSQDHRAYVLSALSCVDFVTVFEGASANRFISLSEPDIYVKGGDYDINSIDNSDRRTLESIGAKCEFIDFEVDISTTKILKSVNQSNAKSIRH